MAENEVPRVQTPITLEVFVAAIRAAYASELGREPDRKTAAVFFGHLMIETSGVAVWNWNLGNIKYVPGCGSDWFDLPGTWEVVNGRKVVLPAGDPGRRFRAYDSPVDGLARKLRFLYSGAGGRYAKAWKDACDGQPAHYARSLKDAGYYTGDVNAYTRGVCDGFFRFMARAPEWTPHVVTETTVADLRALTRDACAAIIVEGARRE